MRYPRGHKEQTRRRILHKAVRKFKKDGLESGVAEIMSEAGLTHGGFYSHFRSKDDLVRGIIRESVREHAEQWSSMGKDSHDLESFISRYLSEEKRDNPGEGCTAAAFSGEIRRQSPRVKTAFTEGFLEMLSNIEETIPGKMEPSDRRRAAMGIFSTIMGALQLSRAVNNPRVSRQLLDAGREAALFQLHRLEKES